MLPDNFLMPVMVTILNNAVNFRAPVMMCMRHGNGSFGLGREHAHQGNCYDSEFCEILFHIA